MTSDRVGWAWVAPPISQGVASSSKRERRLGDEVGGMRPDDVDAERVVGLRVGDDLGEALVLAADDRLGDRLERDLADLDACGRRAVACASVSPIEAISGPAVGRPRLGRVVHVVDVRVAGDRVRGGEALVRRPCGPATARR